MKTMNLQLTQDPTERGMVCMPVIIPNIHNKPLLLLGRPAMSPAENAGSQTYRPGPRHHVGAQAPCLSPPHAPQQLQGY